MRRIRIIEPKIRRSLHEAPLEIAPAHRGKVKAHAAVHVIAQCIEQPF